jgi:hypothetical protein
MPSVSFDDLVGAGEEGGRDGEAKRGGEGMWKSADNPMQKLPSRDAHPALSASSSCEKLV